MNQPDDPPSVNEVPESDHPQLVGTLSPAQALHAAGGVPDPKAEEKPE